MSIPALLMPVHMSGFEGDPCADGPTVNSDTDTTVTEPVCPTTGWGTRSTVSLGGPLGDLQLDRARALDEAGTDWQFWIRDQNLTNDFTQDAPHFSEAEGGDEVSKWFRSRVRLWDPGVGAACGDGSWTTATQIQKDGFLCNGM